MLHDLLRAEIRASQRIGDDLHVPPRGRRSQGSGWSRLIVMTDMTMDVVMMAATTPSEMVTGIST